MLVWYGGLLYNNWVLTYLILGIGNPEEQYTSTRHNIGFAFLDFLARLQRGSPSAAKKTDANDFELDKKSTAQIARVKLRIQGKNVSTVLAKPETYVNLTGPVAAKLKALLKLRPENIIIVQDDLDIPFGKLKLSFDRNSGGHRGIESIMKALKTKKFWRLRLGTQNNKLLKAYQLPEKKKNEFIKDFVLSKFTPSENEELKTLFKSALERLAQKTN